MIAMSGMRMHCACHPCSGMFARLVRLFMRVFMGVSVMALGRVRVMGSLLMVSRIVMLRGGVVMFGSVLVMFRSLAVVLRSFLGHDEYSPGLESIAFKNRAIH